MPRLVFFENGAPPTSRSRRQLIAATEAGWDVTVIVRAGAEVDDLPVRVLTLDREPVHPVLEERRAARARTEAELAEIRAQLSALRDRRRSFTHRAKRLPGLRLAGSPLVRRWEKRAEPLERRAAILHAHRRVLAHIDEVPTPFGVPHPFGDILRLEPTWTEAAQRIATLEWDVAHAADLDALPPVAWAAGATGRPCVFDSHEIFDLLTYLPPAQRDAWRMLTERFLPLADAVLTVSDPSAEALRERGARDVTVVPNYPLRGTQAARSLRQVLGLPPDVPLAVHSGNASPSRRPERAIGALAQMPNLHVAFVGALDQKVTDALRTQAREHDAADRLHILEPVPLEHVASFLRDADVGLILYGRDAGVYASITMPNKVYDYVAAGIPVVAGAGTGAADLVASRRVGEVFAPEGAPSLAQAIRTVLADDQIRRNAVALAPEMDWAKAAPAYLDVLGAVVERAARARRDEPAPPPAT